MARMSEEEERVQQPCPILNEITRDIENISQKIEILNPPDKQTAIDILQDCIDWHQFGADEIPQLDGHADLVIFCDFCNKEFIGDKRVRDRQTHYINEHLRSKFEEITPTKSENYFRCNRSGCGFKTTKKLDFWRHMGGKHELIKIFLKEYFDENPPLIPANGHIAINDEDKETDYISPREEQGSLHANTSTSSFPVLTEYSELTSLHSVPSLKRDTSLVSMASGQAGLSRQVSTPCLQPPETDMRSVRSNISDPAYSQAQASHTPIPGHFSHQSSLHSHQQPHITPGYNPVSLSQHSQPQPCVSSPLTSSLPPRLSATRQRNKNVRQEEEEEVAAAVASILANTIDEAENIVSADVMAPGTMETEGQERETETKREIKFQLPNNASYLVDRDCGQKVDNIISILLKRRSQTLSPFEAFSSENEPIDLSQDCSTLSCNEVLVQPAAADQTQELVNDDECLEPPPRTSTPVPGHDVDISCPSLNTTDILVREHSYSRIGSESFSEPQSMRSVSGYHSLSVSEAEGAAADQGQTTTTSLGPSGYTASCATNQSLSPQMDRANQMTVSFSASPRYTGIHQSKGIHVPSIHEVIIPGPVTSMADFVFTSVSQAPDGEFIKHNVNDF